MKKPALKTAACRTCSGVVVWATTAAGKAMPVNVPAADPANECGNVLIEVSATGRCVAVVYGDDVTPMALTPTQFVTTSHFATCPQSKTWRRKR